MCEVLEPGLTWCEPCKHKNYLGFSLSAAFSLLPAAKLGKSEDSKGSPTRGKIRKYGKKSSLLLESPSTGPDLNGISAYIFFPSSCPGVFCVSPTGKKSQSPQGSKNKTLGSTPKETGKHWWKECLELSLEPCWFIPGWYTEFIGLLAEPRDSQFLRSWCHWPSWAANQSGGRNIPDKFTMILWWIRHWHKDEPRAGSSLTQQFYSWHCWSVQLTGSWWFYLLLQQFLEFTYYSWDSSYLHGMDPGPALTELLIHQCCWFAVLGTWISTTNRNVCKTMCKNAKPMGKPFFLKALPDKIKHAVKHNYQGLRFSLYTTQGFIDLRNIPKQF